MKKLPFIVLLNLFGQAAIAHQQVFDNHVHLWEGEQSLKSYLL